MDLTIFYHAPTVHYITLQQPKVYYGAYGLHCQGSLLYVVFPFFLMMLKIG
jgi:hypothetical protein